MSRRTDRSEHAAELNLVAKAVSHHHGRTATPILDVEQWLIQYPQRLRSSVLHIVWDRADAAILTHRRPELEVQVASGLVDWARRRLRGSGEVPPPR